MQHFAKLTAALFSPGHPAQVAGRLPDPDVQERQSGSVSMWDEALATSISDENARIFLDHRGSRWK